MTDPAAQRFDAIYRENVAPVTAYVRRRTAPDAVADVVADVFVVCWQKLEHVPAPGSRRGDIALIDANGATLATIPVEGNIDAP